MRLLYLVLILLVHILGMHLHIDILKYIYMEDRIYFKWHWQTVPYMNHG